MDWEWRCKELQQRVEELEMENHHFRQGVSEELPEKEIVIPKSFDPYCDPYRNISERTR